MKRLAIAAAALVALVFPGEVDASPPDRIMFERGSALVTAALDGSDVQRVSPDDGHYRTSADWSPDGKRVVYTKLAEAECSNECPELRQLWVLNLAKGTELRITDTASQPFGFAWSPNGRHIAFSAQVAPQQVGNENLSVSVSDHGVWVVNDDGSGVRLLARGHSPTWSPDGGRIAFVCGDTLCIAPADGSSAPVAIPGTERMQLPDWSPDGTALLVQRNALPGTGVGPETVVVSVTGGIEAIFPNWVSARWTPDGASFAFLRSPAVRMLGDVCRPDPCTATEGIWLADRDGSRLRRVTNGSTDYVPQFAR